MIHIRLDKGAANPSASSASSATETDRYEDQSDTTAQIEEARSVLANDCPRVDTPVCTEDESVDIDEKDNVIEMPPPPGSAPGTNTADAVISNAPKRYVTIRRPQGFRHLSSQ